MTAPRPSISNGWMPSSLSHNILYPRCPCLRRMERTVFMVLVPSRIPPSIFDFPQGHYPPTTSAINQYIASSADSIAQSSGQPRSGQWRCRVSEPSRYLSAFLRSSIHYCKFVIFHPTKDRHTTRQRQIQLCNHSLHPQNVPILNYSTPSLFTNPQQPQIQPQVKQHRSHRVPFIRLGPCFLGLGAQSNKDP
jgi:hypothetical protein